MDKETVEIFKNKYVKLERQKPTDDRPFKLFGTIEAVHEESILFRTEQRLGTLRLTDIVSLQEWDD